MFQDIYWGELDKPSHIRFDTDRKMFTTLGGKFLAKTLGNAKDALEKIRIESIPSDVFKFNGGYAHKSTKTFLAHTLSDSLEKLKSLRKVIELKNRMGEKNFEDLQKSLLSFEERYS